MSTEVRGPDLIAENDDEVLLVEAKAGARPIGPEAIRQLVGMSAPEDLRERTIRRILVVPADVAVTLPALDAAKLGNVEIYEVWPGDGVKRVL